MIAKLTAIMFVHLTSLCSFFTEFFLKNIFYYISLTITLNGVFRFGRQLTLCFLLSFQVNPMTLPYCLCVLESLECSGLQV